MFAIAVAAALLLAPAVALWRTLPTWTPAGDNALIELRALDSGTVRNPLIGQPSTSNLYTSATHAAHHPGPIEFYLAAIPVRLLGGPAGLLLVSTTIIGLSVLVAVWAVFRQLGAGAGLVAALAAGLLMFTTGSGSLVDPVSSNLAGYPFLATAVLCWCLLCGDRRLLPLAAVVASFTAQQHLAVLLPTAALVGLATAGVVRRYRHDRPGRRSQDRRLLGLTASLLVVLWAPVAYQQVAGPDGNIAAIASYSGAIRGNALGPSVGLRTLVHSLAVPPLLGRLDLTGLTLVAPTTALDWVTAVLVAAGLGAFAWRMRWRSPPVGALVVTIAVLGVAGVATAAKAPDSYEQARLVLFHWATALSFLVAVAAGLAVVEAGRRVRLAERAPRLVRIVAPAVVASLLVALVAIDPALDRPSSSQAAADATVPRSVFDDLADQVLANRSRTSGPVVLLRAGADDLIGQPDALMSRLAERGLSLVYPRSAAGFVSPDRLVDPSTVRSGLLVVLDPGGPDQLPGRLIAEADAAPGFDLDALDELVEEAEAARHVELGPDLDAALRRRFGAEAGLVGLDLASRLLADPESVLVQEEWMSILAADPPVSPHLDRSLLVRIRDTFPDRMRGEVSPTRIRVYELDRQEARSLEAADLAHSRHPSG